VGNTGNAQFTPAHLHFGVYTYGGAVDPLPFVNRTIKSAPSIADKKLSNHLKLTKTQKAPDGSTVKASTYLVPLAAHAKAYVAEAPDGSLWQVPFAAAQVTKEPVGKLEGVAVSSMESSRKS
jgi:hypothetical protein